MVCMCSSKHGSVRVVASAHESCQHLTCGAVLTLGSFVGSLPWWYLITGDRSIDLRPLLWNIPATIRVRLPYPAGCFSHGVFTVRCECMIGMQHEAKRTIRYLELTKVSRFTTELRTTNCFLFSPFISSDNFKGPTALSVVKLYVNATATSDGLLKLPLNSRGSKHPIVEVPGSNSCAR